MMKKITALMLTLLMCFMLCACSDGGSKGGALFDKATTENVTPEESTSENTTSENTTSENTTSENTTAPTEPSIDVPPTETQGATPILYKVSDADGDVVWLFGSVHVGREEFYPLPDYVMNAYSSSEALAVEANILTAQDDTASLIDAMKPLIYVDGTTIKDHVSEETYTAAVDALTQIGMYSSMLDYYCPAMWSNLIDTAIISELDVDATLGIDMYFLSLATEEGKEIREIESIAFQYSMLGGFSDELQEALLASSVEWVNKPEVYGQELDKLMDIWASGDEKAFEESLSASTEEEGIPTDLQEEYYTAMYSDRNNNMTDYAVDALESGDEIFICVGAAHIIGEDAIADNLRELGYTVELVR